MAPARSADPAATLVADRRLAERIAAGDEPAFDELVARHFHHVARIAGRFFPRLDDAEEIHQETFLKAFTAIASYRGDVPLEHWLARIAVNSCYDGLRRMRRRPGLPAPAREPDDAQRREHADLGDDAAFCRREQARIAAAEMLAMLDPADRLVLTLMVLEEHSAAEVADLTGWSAVNVKVRAFRARKRLRSLLAKAESPSWSRNR